MFAKVLKAEKKQVLKTDAMGTVVKADKYADNGKTIGVFGVRKGGPGSGVYERHGKNKESDPPTSIVGGEKSDGGGSNSPGEVDHSAKFSYHSDAEQEKVHEHIRGKLEAAGFKGQGSGDGSEAFKHPDGRHMTMDWNDSSGGGKDGAEGDTHVFHTPKAWQN